ncbi:MAG: glycosyltransferase family 2 protein [Candidatus Levybacteria bacterium]|nr:glycosyltransferase family 2 protein [Candidatus Levybacteria bacterium]
MEKEKSFLSVVVPVFNEQDSIQAFYKELIRCLEKITKKYEILFVDDGSADKTFSFLKDIQKLNKNVYVFSFRRNLGKAEALTFGFLKSKGDLIVTLDADLQDQPSEIELLIAKQKEGYDVVCGWRKDRKDASKMKIISRIFNATLNAVFHLNIHDYNCGLKLYTSDAAKSLHLYGGLHRFIPVLAYEQGFRISEIPVRHEVRKFGESKYKFSKIKDIPDIFTMLFLVRYMKRPLHFFGAIGGTLSLIGFFILSYLSGIKFFFGQSIGGRPLLFLGVLAVVVGVQIFFSGFIAELLINLSHQKQQQYPLKYPQNDN